MSQRGNGILIIILAIAIVFGCGLLISQPCFWGAASCVGATSIHTPVPMINPQGFPERDQENAQTNIDNSRANINNSEARQNDGETYAIVTGADAANTKTAAEACAIRHDCGVYNYTEGVSAGEKIAYLKIGLVVAAVLSLIAWLRRS